MPARKHFFDHVYEENYVQLYHERTQIVHNNWIEGHKDKKRRFQRYHLWYVENTSFPKCGDHSDGGESMALGVGDRTSSGDVLIIATGVGVSFIFFAWYASTFLRARRRHSFNV